MLIRYESIIYSVVLAPLLARNSDLCRKPVCGWLHVIAPAAAHRAKAFFDNCIMFHTSFLW